MKNHFIILVFIFGILGLNACGFQPLHGNNPEQEITTADIQIMPIADRPGQILHNHLRDLFNPNGYTKDTSHSLSVTISESLSSSGFRVGDDGTWGIYTLTASYKLNKEGEKASLYSDAAVSKVSYSLVSIPYADHPTFVSAQQQALRQVAQTIYTDVSLFLKTREQ